MKKPASIVIRCDYPGGNVKVNRVTSGAAFIESDLRDTPSHWFYWNFEVEAQTDGMVEFHFPGGKQWISAQGPCVSCDGGKSWRWAGRNICSFCDLDVKNLHDSFSWEFHHAGEKIRFAQGFPYQLADFETFLQKNRDNPELNIGILTKTRQKRDCPFLTIGSGEKKLLLTCRHHACEAAASYVMEGFLSEAVAANKIAAAFREKYTLIAVPFMDLDGVENGDQGKGRSPHDHNRDYGVREHLYPEVAAVEELQKKHHFFAALDLHDPAVRSDDCLYPEAPQINAHEHFYFGGWRSPKNVANTNELIRWLEEELPAPCAEVNYFGGDRRLKSDGSTGIPFSHYFGDHPDVTYGTTLEIPYASRRIEYDCTMMRAAGRAILRALMRFELREDPRPRTEHQCYEALTEQLRKSPPEMAEQILADRDMPGLYQMEAHLYLAQIGRDPETHANAVLASPDATSREKDAAQKFCR